jgi:hypothetical protein
MDFWQNCPIGLEYSCLIQEIKIIVILLFREAGAALLVESYRR